MSIRSRKAGATRFTQLTVTGSPLDMGRQVGEAQREHIRELVELVVSRANKGREKPVSAQQAAQIAAGAVSFVEKYAPHMVDELRGVAEGAGVTMEQVMLLNARNMLGPADDERDATPFSLTPTLSRGERATEGCTSLMVSASASATGGAIAGQNWDNDPEMDRFSLVLVRRPVGRPANMTWTQAGLIAYIGLNDAGIGVCMNAMNGPSRRNGVPWYFIVRAFYEAKSLVGAASAAERARRGITANAAMVTPQGAADIEVTPDAVRVLKADDSGRLVHTNHCVHPDLTMNNQKFKSRIFGQSFARKSRAEALLVRHGGPVGVDLMKRILSDHEGFPTAICRHPNSDPVSGWQRSVVSLIVEPSARRMHVSRGNPCEAPYQTYEMN